MIYCFPQHVSCFILLLACSQFRFMFFHACLHVFFLVLIYMFYALCHALDAQIFSFPCVDVWVYMLTCLILCLQPCLAQIYMFVCVSYAPMPMYMPSHACMLGFVFFHVLCLHPHAQMYFYMPTCIFPCLYVQIGVFTCLDRCSLYALCHHLCACVLHALFMCLGLDLVCYAMCYYSPFVPFYRIFLCFGIMVRT